MAMNWVRYKARMKPRTSNCTSRTPHHTLAGVATGDIGEFAFEGAGERDAVRSFPLDRSGGERGVNRLRRAIDDEGRAMRPRRVSIGPPESLV